MLLQEYYFRKSLEEIVDDIDNLNITIDHSSGKCKVNNHTFSLIFPKYMVDLIETISKDKGLDFYFQGLITLKRNWVYDFKNKKKSLIVLSLYGRDPSTKYNLDIEYYKNMCNSKFTLCPKGNCKWTYRFFESILCFSIPIIEDETDIYCSDYFYYKLGDDYEYSYTKALNNYNFLIKNHTFIGKKIENI